MTDLSPAAQAVDRAIADRIQLLGEVAPSRQIAAAALRAAADQRVELSVPFSMIDEWERIKGSCASFYAAAEWGYRQALKDQQAIAAELEGQ